MSYCITSVTWPVTANKLLLHKTSIFIGLFTSCNAMVLQMNTSLNKITLVDISFNARQRLVDLAADTRVSISVAFSN